MPQILQMENLAAPVLLRYTAPNEKSSEQQTFILQLTFSQLKILILKRKKEKQLAWRPVFGSVPPRLSLISRTLQHTQSPVNTCKGAAKHNSCPHGKSSLTAFSSETQLRSAILLIVGRLRGDAPLQDCLCNGAVIRLEIYQVVIGSGWVGGG